MILAATEAGSATAPSLLLLHGLFGQARNFATIQNRLAERWHVTALDLRNHGRSPHQPGMDYASLAADVAETMAALGLPPSHVIGHSMGGKTAMALALTRPALLQRLVVVDIAPVAYAHDNAKLVSALRALPLDAPMTRGQADRHLAPAIPDAAIRGFLLQNFVSGSTPSWRCGLTEIHAAIPQIEGWDLPETSSVGETLLIRGGDSPYVGERKAAAFSHAFPNSRIDTVEGAGHWVHADAPDRFLRLVESFIEGKEETSFFEEKGARRLQSSDVRTHGPNG